MVTILARGLETIDLPMKRTILLLTALASLTIATHANEIQIGFPKEKDTQITLTGKLGSYKDKEDGFMITITTNDVAVPRDPTDWSNALPNSIPVKQVAIYNSDKHPELKKAAAEGKTVTLRGSLAIWERHLKLGRHDVLMFTLN